MAPYKPDSLAGSAAKKKNKKPILAEPLKIKKKKIKSGNKKKKSSGKAAGNAGDDSLVDDKPDDQSSIADQSGAAMHKYTPGRVVSIKDLHKSDVGLGVNGQPYDFLASYKPSPARSASKDETFVTVEEFDPQEEEEIVKVKQEPVSPTLPRATVFNKEAVALEDSVADEDYATPLQSPVLGASSLQLTKENVPLRSESRVPLPRFPPYEQAKRSASPSPSSQLRNENPSALMTLVNNINTRNEKQSSPSKARATQDNIIKATPIPNSTNDQHLFPPTSPLNIKTPKPMPSPGRMLQFDSSPNRFSPSMSNKCTPVPLPMTKGFPAAPRLGTPFRAGVRTEEDPLTPAEVDDILNNVMAKNDSNDERGDTGMHDAPAADTRGDANGEESDIEMSTIIKDEQHDNLVAKGSVKKTKKPKKDKKRRLEEPNALDDDDTITVSAPKKAKKTKKKKSKKVDVQEEQENENIMDLDGTTQVDESTVLGETTQLEVDRQLQEAMQLANTEHGGASETVSAPKDVNERTADQEIKEIIVELTSPVKKKKSKKSRKAKKAEAEVEEQQAIETEEVVAPVIHVAHPEQPMEIEQATDVAPAIELSPRPEAKMTKKARKSRHLAKKYSTEEAEPEQNDIATLTTASGLAAAISSDPLLSIAKQVVKFDNNLTYSSEISQLEINAIKQNLAVLDQRVQANELRASIRQEILFNALKKVSMDINKLNASIAKGGEVHVVDSPDSSPGEVARDRLFCSARATNVGPNGPKYSVTPIPLPKLGNTKAVSSHHRETPASGARGAGAKAAGPSGNAFAEARKNQDKLLAGFTEEMNAAKDAKTVEIKGRLCVKYADDLFKMF